MRHLPRLVSAGLAALALAACENAATAPKAVAAAAPRHSVAIQSIRQPFAFGGYTCDLKPLSGSGYITLTYTTTVDAAGSLHVHYTQLTNGIRATDSTGGSYVASEAMTESDLITPAGGGTSTSTDSFRLIGLGKTTDEVLRHLTHFTINANGAVTVYFDTFTDACR